VPRLTAPVVEAGTLARLPQPILAAGGFALRPWQPSDAEAVAVAYADRVIQRWFARTMSEDEARVWIGSWPTRWVQESGAGWAVATEAVLLGQISLRLIDLADGIAELSYWIAPAARGRGVASAALSTITAWAFEQLGLHRLELEHSTLNPASCRVADKAGYPAEGTKRSHALHADGWHDMHLHARVNGAA
jgi:RimJ/RimL family protein N-acetyltransferase